MAGADMKAIKRRMKSVESTMQITKAMELVSSSKLRRAQERAEQAAPYFRLLDQTLGEMAAEARWVHSVYTESRDNVAVLLIIIAGDRGLAGGFDMNVFRRADARIAELEQQGRSVMLMTVGKKAGEYYAKRHNRLLGSFEAIGETVTADTTLDMAEQIISLLDAGQLTAVEICYTEPVSPLIQEVCHKKLIPIPYMQKAEDVRRRTVYEPSAEAVFEAVIPQYLSGMLYCTIVSSFAAEQAARRLAMENATDNAQEMIDDLSLRYHRARQAVITRELTEIVGGANAQR